MVMRADKKLWSELVVKMYNLEIINVNVLYVTYHDLIMILFSSFLFFCCFMKNIFPLKFWCFHYAIHSTISLSLLNRNVAYTSILFLIPIDLWFDSQKAVLKLMAIFLWISLLLSGKFFKIHNHTRVMAPGFTKIRRFPWTENPKNKILGAGTTSEN